MIGLPLLFMLATASFADTSPMRDLTPDELKKIQIYWRTDTTSEGVVYGGGCFSNGTGLELATIDLAFTRLLKEKVVYAKLFSVTNFQDEKTGYKGHLLSNGWAHYREKIGPEKEVTYHHDGDWFEVVGAKTYAEPDLRIPSHLFQAILNGDTGKVKAFLKKNPSFAAKVDLQTGMSPIQFAAIAGRLPMYNAILAAGVKKQPVGPHGETIMHYAAMGSAEMIKALHAQGHDLNATDDSGFTPLHISCRYGNPYGALTLLELGAKPDVVAKNKQTPLILSVESNSILPSEGGQMVYVLVNHGADPNTLHPNEGYEEQTVFADICQRGFPPLIEYLLDHGAKIDGCGPSGFTPLHGAAKYGNAISCAILLKRGANRDLRTINGNTAADLARMYGHEDLSRFIEGYQKPKSDELILQSGSR